MSEYSLPELPPHTESPNFEHWARAKFWRVAEAVALSLNCSPDEFNFRQALDDLDYLSGAGKRFTIAFRDRFLIVERNFINHHSGIRPTEFLHWLEAQRLPVPSGMAEAVKEFDIDVVDWKIVATNLEIERSRLSDRITELQTAIADGAISSSSATREKDSLLKLFIGMAVNGYAYKPKTARSTTASEIASDLQKLGLTITDDTIRKYLREGAELLPRDEAE